MHHRVCSSEREGSGNRNGKMTGIHNCHIISFLGARSGAFAPIGFGCVPHRFCFGYQVGHSLMTSSSLGATAFVLFGVLSVVTLKELNVRVTEPYMVRRRFCICHVCSLSDIKARQDEPFHVPQAQAYCNGDWSYWDQKITTPPGL